MCRPESKNPNWKGGISLVKNEDELLEIEEKYFEDLRFRFLTKVKENEEECWIWLGSTFNGRYGRFTLGKLSLLAHRVAFVLFNKKPIGNFFVCHSCDNTLCVRPDHLWLGTPKENTQDMMKKGRWGYAEACIGIGFRDDRGRFTRKS